MQSNRNKDNQYTKWLIQLKISRFKGSKQISKGPFDSIKPATNLLQKSRKANRIEFLVSI